MPDRLVPDPWEPSVDVSLTDEQTAIAGRFSALFRADLLPALRRLYEHPAAPGPSGAPAPEDATAGRAVWRALVELGATRLLLPTELGGEGAGQRGAVVLAELAGTALYGGPLLDTMTATEALLPGAFAAADGTAKYLAEIADGAAVPLAPRARGHDDPADPAPLPAVGTPGIRLHRRLVAAAPEGRYLLVLGRAGAAAGGGVHGALVRSDDPTLTCRRHEDVTRGGLYAVELADTPVLAWVHPADPVSVTGVTGAGRARGGARTGDAASDAGAAGGLGAVGPFRDADPRSGWPGLVARARLRHAGYLVGLVQGALDLAVARVKERRQFGRELGRFQALAFRLAELTARTEGVRWLVRSAAWEADTGRDPRLTAAQSLAAAADLAGDATAAAMQLHGAYGLTDAADIQICYRRAHLDRVWQGSAAALRREVFPLLVAERKFAHRTDPAG